MSHGAVRTNGDSPRMATWTAQTRVAGLPDEVLAMLTDPSSIARWAPIEFDVVDFERRRLQAGDRVRVRGGLAGRSVEFEVDVSEADDGHFVLTAVGPIRLDVEYLAVAAAEGSEVHASITVTGQGLIGRVLAQATDALLAAGALHNAVDRIAGELEPALTA
jgi:Polyketide cyclase / dehydrase and lipid transport